MKIVSPLVKAFLLVTTALCVAGCQAPGTTPTPKGKAARFHEGREVNVVLRFNSWDYIFMVQPDYREDGFLRPLKRNDVALAIRALNLPHDLAVVTIGWYYNAEEQAKLIAEWKNILSNCGFRRVVILRPNNDKLNGSIIVEDSRLSAGI